MQIIRNAVLLILVVALVSGCASVPVTKTAEIPRGTKIVVIPFRDCLINGQDEDCNGSGLTAAEAYRQVFNEGGKFTSTLAERPVGPKETLTDAAAAEYARKMGYEYVLVGEVDDFYAVAPMTFRVDRAATTTRIIRASDGMVVASYSKQGTAGSNFATPAGMIRGIAIAFRDAL